MEFKDNLYRIRKEKGMSQEELAALCDVSRQAISKWENGTANPDMENLKTLSRSLQVSIDELLGNKIPLEKEVVKEKEVIYVHNRYTYEKRYRSKLSICGIPLVDINVGRGRTEEGYWRVAKGIIAIGNVSVGVISIGLLSVGLCSLGHTGAIVRHRSACIILLCHWLSGYRLHQHRCDCYRCIQYRCDFHRV